MNSGKASPLAFVADEKIYVIGSSRWDSDENFAYFEMFDPKVDNWIILPNPPIRNPHETERLYCFDLDTHKWANTSIPDYLGKFSGDTQFVEHRLYGCYYDTVAALVPLEEEEEEEEEEEKEEEEEEEEEAEDKELQQFFKHHRLHEVSEGMGMDAIRNVPPQVQYSASLLHLGKMYFCYVRTGMPPHPHPKIASDFDIGDDKKRFISIVIFKVVRGTYIKNDTRFSKANLLHSEHYEVNTPFPSDGFIKGCYVLGSVWDTQSRVNRSASKVGWGCRKSWAEDVQARVSIAKVTLNPVISFSLKQHFVYKINLVVGLKLFTNFWMYIATEESRSSSGPHKLRVPAIDPHLANKLKYALTYREVIAILKQRHVLVDGKVRTDKTYPASFIEVVSIPKTNENFRLLCDTKGQFRLHSIRDEEAKFKLCKVHSVQFGQKGIPYLNTFDGRTIRYLDPLIKANNTIKLDLESQKITEFIKFNVGHEFTTRLGNVFTIGKGTKPWVSLTKGKGIKLPSLKKPGRGLEPKQYPQHKILWRRTKSWTKCIGRRLQRLKS
ncbi:uncharacterized protein LOC112027914 [Quercus suber]|uniref:uncharacterized protein LOC112027914 n=1 Tax=Quercus suber TaxID=58331 RepID=UPI0032DFCE7A